MEVDGADRLLFASTTRDHLQSDLRSLNGASEHSGDTTLRDSASGLSGNVPAA